MPPQHEYFYDSNKILRDIEANNTFFDNLVDMFPAKLYVAGNTGDEMYNPKYKAGQSKESKESRRARKKASYAKKFDPQLAETTRQAKRRLENEDDESDDDDDDDHDVVTHDADDSDGHDNDEPEASNSTGQSPSLPSADSASDGNKPSYESRIEILRAKLRAKLEASRANRPANGTNDATVSKRARRRAEKKRKIEQAKLRNSTGSTQIHKDHKPRLVPTDDDRLGGTKILALDDNPMDTADTADLSGIDYGGIAGLKDDIGHNYADSNKSLKNMGKKKSLQHLLAVAAKNKEKLERLKASQDLEDKEKAKNLEWGNAFKAADGTRSNSDPALLKKAIKRKAKKKAKSQKSWKTRMEGVRTKMDERQKIRQHNIGQRKLGGAAGANLSSKRIDNADDAKDDSKGNKRPRLGPHSGNTAARPGFEGKKQDFINSAGGKGKKAASNN